MASAFFSSSIVFGLCSFFSISVQIVLSLVIKKNREVEKIIFFVNCFVGNLMDMFNLLLTLVVNY